MERQVERRPLPATIEVYEAAVKGDIPSLVKLLEEDPLILQRCTIENSGRIMQSPLHVAANMGHSQFAVEILNRMPELAEVVDPTSRSSPLHVASAKGHFDIVKSLVNENPSMCLARDQDGRTPIHVAAAKGQVNVVELLHHANRYAAQERTANGETILHMCVKHGQLEALKILTRLNGDDGDQLINSKDNNGNTILHLAVTSKQPEMVEYLLDQCKSSIEINALNNKDMTAVDLYKKQSEKSLGDGTIEQSLKHAKVKSAKDTVVHRAQNLNKQRSALMVVASLIATMSFQAGINPPGGVWQDRQVDDNGEKIYTDPGTAIWSYYADTTYRKVLISNTIGLISSLSVILLLISGLPFTRHFLSILRVTVWIAVTATSVTYLFTISYVTGIREGNQAIFKAVKMSLCTWIGLVAAVFLGHVIRFILKVMGWQRRQSIKKLCKHYWLTLRNKDAVKNRLDLEVSTNIAYNAQ